MPEVPGLFGAPQEPEAAQRVVRVNTESEAVTAVKHELKQVRRWAAARLRAGQVPEWSWDQHVRLIEAIDAVLHDLSVMPDRAEHACRLSDRIRLLPSVPSQVRSSLEKVRRSH